MAQLKLLSDTGVGQVLESARDNFSQIVERSRISSIISWQKEAGLARQIILRDERLLQADPESIKNAITNIAVIGLTLNPIKQHATILARWNNNKSCYEAQLMVMYRGLMWLAGQAGVTDIVSEVVYTADKFSTMRTSEGDKYEHLIAHAVPRDGISSKFMGGYIAARMPGSKLMKVEWVPAEDVYVAREKSDSYKDKKGNVRDSSPWVWTFDEMAKKVFIKRGQKRWEEAVVENDDWKRFQTAVALDNANEGVVTARISDIPGTSEHIQSGNKEPEQVVKLSMAQIAEIEKLVEQVAPNTDAFPNNTNAYMVRVARTYRANALSEVDATKFDEIKKRVKDAIAKQAHKKAADPKAASKDETPKQGDAGVNKDVAAKGASKEGASGSEPQGNAGRTRVAGGQIGGKTSGGPTSGGSVGTGTAGQGGTREPGSDDGDPGPQDPDQR